MRRVAFVALEPVKGKTDPARFLLMKIDRACARA